ncbi:MAG TPA: GNAT family N-acetyltransferase [Acidobacteriaceae bacterium]|nr:GNAT family N-acetyltransferase [Acidobacteriaceae bacterium]
MTRLLETPRLLLRPLELADADQTQQLFPHWEIVRFLSTVVPWPYPSDGALAWYRDIALPAVARGEQWHWTLRLRSAADRLIGAVGLFRSDDNNRGFWLVPELQGQGLMTEAVVATNDYWFNVLGFPLLRVSKAAANLASRRISEKTGMRLVATGEKGYVSGTLAGETWEITAEEWRAFREHLRSERPAR